MEESWYVIGGGPPLPMGAMYVCRWALYVPRGALYVAIGALYVFSGALWVLRGALLSMYSARFFIKSVAFYIDRGSLACRHCVMVITNQAFRPCRKAPQVTPQKHVCMEPACTHTIRQHRRILRVAFHLYLLDADYYIQVPQVHTRSLRVHTVPLCRPARSL